MASLTRDDNIDWFWGSLKPWQILHSTLAERERNGSPLDVWELVNETLGANTTNVIRREDEVAVQEQQADKGWAHKIKFLGDDGEFWRHGGVMESRIRDWLMRKHEDDQSSTVLHNHSPTGSELAIAYCSSIAAPAPQCYDYSSSTISQIAASDCVSDDDDDDESSGESEEGEEANAVDEDDDNDQGILHLSAADQEEDYRDNYAMNNGNYDASSSTNCDGNYVYSGCNTPRDQCRLVVNRCCGAAAAVQDNDHDTLLQVGAATAKLAAGPYLEQEMVEEIEVCAVCLEKLNNDDEEEAVQALACRHLFHRDCIAPWLERQPHACCPCCRAPILAPPQLHSAAPLNLAAPAPATCYGNHHRHHAQRDIMGLLADMEAALERLGFRS